MLSSDWYSTTEYHNQQLAKKAAKKDLKEQVSVLNTPDPCHDYYYTKIGWYQYPYQAGPGGRGSGSYQCKALYRADPVKRKSSSEIVTTAPFFDNTSPQNTVGSPTISDGLVSTHQLIKGKS
jgi:hypothetical protein